MLNLNNFWKKEIYSSYLVTLTYYKISYWNKMFFQLVKSIQTTYALIILLSIFKFQTQIRANKSNFGFIIAILAWDLISFHRHLLYFLRLMFLCKLFCDLHQNRSILVWSRIKYSSEENWPSYLLHGRSELAQFPLKVETFGSGPEPI